MQDELQRQLRIQQVFDPEGARKRIDLLFNNRRLVHYTSAETAMKIIGAGEVWMRNVRCMNDFMEVEHGIKMMRRFFAPPSDESPDLGRSALFAALDGLFPELSSRTLERMNGWLETIRLDSFITCISEHHIKENENGRLSMWRSYGMGSVGVGLVISPMPLYSTTDALKAYSNPVSYQTAEEFFASMRTATDNIKSEHDFLKSQGEDEVFNSFFNLLLNTALCSKHPGFEEEQEWRIMHIPQMWSSEVLVKSTEIIGGIPQTVYKIPLKDIPSKGLSGIEIPSIIERVIIGPTEYPLIVYKAFVDALTDVGVSNAGEKVVASQIPLRNGG